ncbi:MAG: outer membrane protein OmpA-like peptidoglycan-associated protein [Planctomycetota bacterium]|jgi:outer membrane protein OmpA-like peptidoglycan-associated protein
MVKASKYALSLFMTGVLLLSTVTAQASCEDLFGQFERAYSERRIEPAVQLNEQIKQTYECLGEERKYARFAVSDLRGRELEQKIGQQVASGISRKSALLKLETRLIGATGLSPGWRILVLQGELAHIKGDHGLAASYFSRARKIIENRLLTTDPEDRDRIVDVYRMAERADLLSPVYKSGGAVSRGPRGFVVNNIIPAITFKYGTDELTAKGQAALTDVLHRLASADSVYIQGHTDPDGTRADNQVLSERRAHRVAVALRNQGFTGNIETTAHGEEKPLKVENRDYFDSNSVCQLLRRVEIQIGGNQNSTGFDYGTSDDNKNLVCH